MCLFIRHFYLCHLTKQRHEYLVLFCFVLFSGVCVCLCVVVNLAACVCYIVSLAQLETWITTLLVNCDADFLYVDATCLGWHHSESCHLRLADWCDTRVHTPGYDDLMTARQWGRDGSREWTNSLILRLKCGSAQWPICGPLVWSPRFNNP